MDAVEHEAAGGLTVFVGRVRDHDHGMSVAGLDYSAHPDAQQIIERVVAEALAQSDPDGVVDVVAVHRIGHLEVGDLALVVVAASTHRAPTFEVCRAVVEAVKHGVPIWKKQHEADGSHTWSGLTC